MSSKVTKRKHNRRRLKRWKQLGFGGKVWRVVWVTFVSLWLLTVLQVVVYKFVMPPITPHMISRYFQQRRDPSRQVRFEREYVSIDDISPNLINATLIAEDWLFAYHQGFLFYGLHRAYLDNKQGLNWRGGSTITQQTAKNCFLPFDKTLLRKVIEAHYTFLIEKIWGKKRIMECYLNVVEFGDGIYGCEAACRHYFHHSSKTISIEEAVSLAAMLSSPLNSDPYYHTDLYDLRIAKIEKYIYNQTPTRWDQKREEMDPVKSAEGNRGLFYFLKWWCLRQIKN